MHSFSTLSLLATLASVASLAAALPAAGQLSDRAPRGRGGAAAAAASGNGKAIYIISNAAKNAVVALPIASNGQLSVAQASSTSTGGAGESGKLATGDDAGPDALFSQSAVTLAGNSLFAVNPGSNTVSMFAIDARNPTKLTAVGQPAAIPGEFPNTVAASAANGLVCVGTTGAKAGVSCGPFSASTGIGALDALRPFDLNQTTPPVGPTNTVSQVFFSDDQKTLFATVKGDGTPNNLGFLASFAVAQNAKSPRSACRPSAGAGASVAAAGTTSSPNGTAVLFGSSTIPGSSNLFLTDASFGAAVVSVDGTQQAQTVGRGVIADQTATCWVAISPATKTAFVADVGLDRLVEMSLTDASPIGAPIDFSANGDPGLTDLRAAGSFVYALSPGNSTVGASVTVMNAVTKKQVQRAAVAGLSASAQGMAILV